MRTKTKNDIQFYHRHRIKDAGLANQVAQADGKYGVLFRRAQKASIRKMATSSARMRYDDPAVRCRSLAPVH